MNRRQFVSRVVTTAVAGSQCGRLIAQPINSHQVPANDKNEIQWHDVQQWGVEGRGWTDTIRYFDRLPAKAEKKVRSAVWNLSRHSAGMAVRFATNSSQIRVRYKLLSSSLAMPHMPATGVSGVDLYCDDEMGEARWLSVAFPRNQNVDVTLASGIDPLEDGGARNYTAYLPLYNGVETLEFGVPGGREFKPIAPRTAKPLVFYGTSIMHGACASRPGMAIPAILGRRLKLPTINLGFSGNGRMEPEVGALLSELDATVFALDCLPNMTGPDVAARTAPLVRQLREAHPETPILLVEDRTYAYARFRVSARKRHEASRREYRKAYDELIRSGIKGLDYIEGSRLLRADGEDTTDGSHPSDYGMAQYADAYEPVLRKLLDG